jgi:hypothetical protein
MMNNKGNGEILLILGVVLLIIGVSVGLVTGISEVNGSKNSVGNTQNIVPVIGSALFGYLIAFIFTILGILFIVLGVKG